MAGPASNEWVGLNEATAMLGVSASTVRRWADEGSIRSFVTPGGHRRLWRPAIESLIPGTRTSVVQAGILGDSERTRMTRLYRREIAHVAPGDVPWAAELDDDARRLFRDHGRQLVASMLSALDASDEREANERLVMAMEAARAYGCAAATIGLRTSESVDSFLRFRRPFVAELSALARRRGLDAAATTDLVDRARDAFDRLLVAMVRAHEEEVASGRTGQRAVPSASVGASQR